MNCDVKKCRIMNFRPMFILALSLATGIVVGRFLSFSIIYIIVAAVLGIAAICLHRKRVFVIVCAATVLLGVFVASKAADADYIDVNDSMSVSGRVVSAPYVTDYGSLVLIIDQAQINETPVDGVKIYLDVDEPLDIGVGDVVETSARVTIPKGVRNPGGFDERLYLLSQGVEYKAYADRVRKTGERGGPMIWSAKASQYIGGVVEAIFEKDAAPVAKAMLLGDKQDLSEDTYDAFKDTGMAHILAVSGLHAGILIAFVYFLLRLLRAGRAARLIITLVFIMMYAFVTGFSPSILRASIMAIALLLGTHFGRQNDSLRYLSIAFMISLLLSPLDLFSAGFALSFGAVFGILTLGWQVNYWLNRRTHERLKGVNGAVAMSAGATAGTMPILASTFNRISTFSAITNIFIIPLASLVIVLVFVATIVGLIYEPAGAVAAYVPGVLIRFMTMIIDGIASVPFVAVDVASPPWYFVIGCFVILFVISKFVLIKAWVKAAACAVIVLAVAAAMLISAPGGMYMVFLDVGQADSAFVRTEQGGEYFIDGGSEYSANEVVDFTIRNGITPDAAFVSHSDEDHFSGIVALYNAGLLSKVYCSNQEVDVVAQAMPNAQVVGLSAGDVVWLDEVTKVTVLYPSSSTEIEERNDASLVLLLEYNGYRALFTGDISGATETQLFENIGEVDIYKAAHHGSKFSSYQLPLSVLSPEHSVVSVGSNSYGHPHEWAIANLEEYSEQVYTTKEDYAIEFYIGKDIEVNTYGERE